MNLKDVLKVTEMHHMEDRVMVPMPVSHIRGILNWIDDQEPTDELRRQRRELQHALDSYERYAGAKR